MYKQAPQSLSRPIVDIATAQPPKVTDRARSTIVGASVTVTLKTYYSGSGNYHSVVHGWINPLR
jgi:hypothetical protein